MEILFYFGKVIFTSGVLFLYYRLFLKDMTFHHYNRFYLLVSMMISFILPLLKVSYLTLEVNPNIYLLLNKFKTLQTDKNLNHDFIYTSVFAFAFGLVAVFFLTKLIFGLVKIQVLKKKFRKEHFEGISFYQTNLEDAPFSFFKNLFWRDSILIHSDLGRQILKHEMVHIEQKHSWDKIFLEITTSLFWFNPFFYLIKKEINLIHEYLADHKALKNSDTKAFAQMLLASQISGKKLSATSPFLSSNLKKRLTMLKKSKTKFSYARRILALPLLFAVTFIYMVNAKNKEINTTNLEIEQIISSLKADTLAPPPPPPPPIPEIIDEEAPELAKLQAELQRKEKALQPMNEALQLKSEEAKKLSDKMKVKSDELQKLTKLQKTDSPKFKALEKDLSELETQMDKIFKNKEFEDQVKLQKKGYGEIDQLYAKLDQYYNSADFKNKIKDAEIQAQKAEQLVNSPKFKKQIAKAEKEGKKAEKLLNSPEFKKKIAEAEKKAAAAEQLVNTPEFKKKIADAEKLAEDEVNKIVNQNPSLNTKENIDIFIEGKPSSNEEMNNLDPNKIESVNVFKKGFNGKKNGEIYIKLKK